MKNLPYLENRFLKLEFKRVNGHFLFQYYIRKKNSWELILTGYPEVKLGREDRREVENTGFDTFQFKDANKSKILISSNKERKDKLVREITLSKKEFHIITKYRFRRRRNLESFQDTYEPVKRGNWDYWWAPAARPREDFVIGDHAFRSPAVILQKNNLLLALIPDLKILSKDRKMKTALDFTLEKFSYGFKEWVPYGHVFYRHDESMYKVFEDDELTFGYYIYIDSCAQRRKGVGRVTSLLWNRYARSYLKKPPCSLNFDKYAKLLLDWTFSRKRYGDILWKEIEIGKKRVGGVVTQVSADHKITINQIWNGVFRANQIQQAYGIYSYGRKWSNPELVERSNKMKEFSLSAPNQGGAFPVVYDLDKTKWILAAGEGPEGMFSTSQTKYHLGDCSWTIYWLLKWFENIERDERIIEYAEKYAQFLIEIQLPSGAIPAWVRKKDFIPCEELKESAESSCSLLPLVKLFILTQKLKYLSAAERIGKFLIEEIFSEERWEDFESYFSCSYLSPGTKELGKRDPFTGLYFQGTLCIYWTALALKELYRATKKNIYLDYGIEALRRLCLYQQVWAPPYLSLYTFGGFGAQLSDGEWNDARQGWFAPLFVEYYKLTGEKEFLERGMAALRAAFAQCYYPGNKKYMNLLERQGIRYSGEREYGMIFENYAHGGEDKITGNAWIFDSGWSHGYIVTALAEIENY